MVAGEPNTGGDGGLTKREVLRAGAGVGMSGIAAAAFSGAGAAAAGSPQSKEISEETKEKLKKTAQAYNSKKNVVAAFKSEGQPLIAALRKDGYLRNESIGGLIQRPVADTKDNAANTIVRAHLVDGEPTADITVTLKNVEREIKLRLQPEAGTAHALLRPNKESEVTILKPSTDTNKLTTEATTCCSQLTVCTFGCGVGTCGCSTYTVRCCNGYCNYEIKDAIAGCDCDYSSPIYPCEPVSCPDCTSY